MSTEAARIAAIAAPLTGCVYCREERRPGRGLPKGVSHKTCERHAKQIMYLPSKKGATTA